MWLTGVFFMPLLSFLFCQASFSALACISKNDAISFSFFLPYSLVLVHSEKCCSAILFKSLSLIFLFYFYFYRFPHLLVVLGSLGRTGGGLTSSGMDSGSSQQVPSSHSVSSNNSVVSLSSLGLSSGVVGSPLANCADCGNSKLLSGSTANNLKVCPFFFLQVFFEMIFTISLPWLALTEVFSLMVAPLR